MATTTIVAAVTRRGVTHANSRATSQEETDLMPKVANPAAARAWTLEAPPEEALASNDCRAQFTHIWGAS